MAKRGSGTYKERVEIWQSVYSTDALKGQVDNPVMIKTTWASIKVDKGRRGLEFEQPKNDAPYLLKLREDPAIDVNANDYFLVWGTKTLIINSVEPDVDRNDTFIIRATHKV